ncbi:MAG: CoA ester lyase [Deltaproteobacteria bacterium]|nr:CoA ester lyase [Deltaproteobacteria bacterium]
MPESGQNDPRWRLERSLLSVPVTEERFIGKAAGSEADTIMLDLEDAIAPERKEQARGLAIGAVNGQDWGTRTVMVRINPMDGPWGYRDLVDVAENCPRLDLVMVPKVERPEDIVVVATLLHGIEQARGRGRPVGIECLVETALGMTMVEQIAAAHPRLESISFGPGDYAASIGNRGRLIGGPDPDYAVLTAPGEQGERQSHWNDVWHYPLARLAVACKARGIRALDGVYVDYADLEGFRSAARRAAALGFDGKWAIHPTQIAPANEIFGPTPENIRWAGEVLSAMAGAHDEGRGAVGLGGEMLDMAHVRQARRIMFQARQIQDRQEQDRQG